MKAKQDFVIYLDSNKNMTSHYSGDPMTGKSELKFKVNDEVPDNLVGDLLKTNPGFLQVDYEAGQFKLTNEELVKYGLKSGKIERPPIVPPRKYSQESLTKILNSKGVEELKRIAEEEFGMKDIKASKSLIVKILNESEKQRRERRV